MPLVYKCQSECKDGYCEKTRRHITDGYCQIVSKGEWESHVTLDISTRREKVKRPLTKREKGDTSVVSVLIPYGEYDRKYLDRTINSLNETAVGRIEVLTAFDENEEGHRVLTNRMAAKAKGRYLYRLDAHCKMSNEWDARMKSSCENHVIVKPILDGLDPETWQSRHRDQSIIVLDSRMRNVYPVICKSIEERRLEEDTMSITGAAYMVTANYYWKSGVCDESYGRWGAAGLEWSLKTWLTGGRVLVRTDVVCAHLFRENGKTPFKMNEQEINDTYLRIGRKWRENRGEGQTRTLSWLTEKFAKQMKNIGTPTTKLAANQPAAYE